MTKKSKAIPRFKTEDQERAFWSRNDATDFVDFSKAEPAIFPELEASTRTISIRIPVSLLQTIKVLANQRDVPYQSLMKLLLAHAVAHQRTKQRPVRRKPTRSTRPRGRITTPHR